MDLPFLSLGQTLAAARAAAGIGSQAELATLLGVSQQSVSRWEAGTHRPKADQLPAIAEKLRQRTADLRRLAGYDAPPTVSYAAPFPFDRLDPVTFEQLTADLMQLLHRGAKVWRAGGTGHTQDGLDVEVRLTDGRTIGVQCKRVERFGAGNIAEAVAKATAEVGEMVLVMSRVASPGARKALRNHPTWSLWDKDDLSRMIRRDLAPDEQEKLVDIYFRGQREALLGRPEPGPWFTVDEFFRPYEDPHRPFSHSWELLGRDEDLDRLVEMLTASDGKLTLLTAAGGMGKTRLLKAALHRLQELQPGTLIRVLNPAADATPESLDRIGPGSKLLVVDDAHDRDGLNVILAHATDPTRLTKVLLVSRPYAMDRIRREGALYNFGSPHVLALGRLSRSQLVGLARQVLRQHGAPEDWGETIAAASGDSPLVVALSARAIAIDRVPLELAKAHGEVRDLILGKFAKVILGDLGGRNEDGALRDVLEVLALVQPFHPGDHQLLELIGRLRGLSPPAVTRALRNILEGGLAVRRGHQTRLMPDVLGDYLIETTGLDAVDRLSPFVEAALQAAPPTLLTNMIINLGRLDWRMSEGDTTRSSLLAGVWSKMDNIVDEWDPRLNAIKAVAIFQPRQALGFIADQVRAGRRLHGYAEILRNIAYADLDFEAAATLLWQLGRDDDRELGPNPGHAIRTLNELGDYGYSKPLKFSEQLLSFALRLADDATQWKGRYTPLDLMKPLLATEGRFSRSNGREITLSSFLIDYDKVRTLRETVIAKVLDLLRDTDPGIACAAARFLATVIQRPLGYFGRRVPDTLYDTYDEEFAETLSRIHEVIRAGLPPIVVISIARAVSWHAQNAGGAVADAAQQVIDDLPEDTGFRVLCALVDGLGRDFIRRPENGRWLEHINAWVSDIVAAIVRDYPDPSARLAFINAALDAAVSAGEELNTGHNLIHGVAKADPRFAALLLDAAIAGDGGRVSDYAAMALNVILYDDAPAGRGYVRRMIDSGQAQLAASAARAYQGYGARATPEDFALLTELAQREERYVVGSVIQATMAWEEADPGRLIDLYMAVDPKGDTRLADDLAMSICAFQQGLVALLSQPQAKILLGRLDPIEEFRGYWIDKVLSDLSLHFPIETATFFIWRVERAAATTNYRLHPTSRPHGADPQRLKFLESTQAQDVLDYAWTWLQSEAPQTGHFQTLAAATFEAMFHFSGPALVEFLEPKLDSATPEALTLMAKLIGETEHEFAFNHAAFIIRFLDRCQTTDPASVKAITGHLYGSVFGGVRSGTPGEPFPRDLSDLARAKEILATLTMVSPAYELYETVVRRAEMHIAESRLEAEVLDDD
jgi:transcriptional regulator with XRE-family HTH domain